VRAPPIRLIWLSTEVSPVRMGGSGSSASATPKTRSWSTNVQTCPVPRPQARHRRDGLENVYIYVSLLAGPTDAELVGCVADPPDQDPNSALLRIDSSRYRPPRRSRRGS
jgi:hypothetical protein